MNKKDFEMLLVIEPVLFSNLSKAAAELSEATAGTTEWYDRFKTGYQMEMVRVCSLNYLSVKRLITNHESISDTKRVYVDCHALGQWHWPAKDRDNVCVSIEDLFKKAKNYTNALFGGSAPDIDWASLEAR